MTISDAIVIRPADLRGDVAVPLSKSLLHRAAICAALAGDVGLADLGSTRTSADISATLRCLTAIQAYQAEPSGEDALLDCGESGSTLRFLIPIAAALGVPATFVGHGRLPDRPLQEYISLFDGKGVELAFQDAGKSLPLRIRGKLLPGVFSLSGKVTSQYVSGLLMALPILSGDSEIHLLTSLESKPYVRLTIDVMKEFGVFVKETEEGYRVSGGQSYARKKTYASEPDFSQAAFWLTAGYLGHDVHVLGLPESSLQGDRECVRILEDLAHLQWGDTYTIDASQIPDLIPTLAIAAAASAGETIVIGAARLRLKECDRLHATAEMLSALGIKAKEGTDTLRIEGRGRYEGRPIFGSCAIDAYNDHRMVMASAVAATRAEGPVRVSDPGAVVKSYPTFFDDFRKLGGDADELWVGE